MKDFFEAGTIGFILGILLGVAVFMRIGMLVNRSYMRAEAISARVAHWEIDPQTGARTFVYHSPVESK